MTWPPRPAATPASRYRVPRWPSDAGTASLASLQVAPGSALVIAAGDAVLDLAGPEPSTIASLFMSAGTLSGAGTRTVTGSAVLDAGTLAGSGRTVIAPEARLQVGSGAGGTLTINGGHVLALEAGATGVWGPGPHDITLDAPSRIENAGTLDITNDRTLRGSGTLANTGTLRKLSHGTTGLALLLDLDGTLAIEAGSSTSPAGTGASAATAPSRSWSAPACASTTAPRPSGAAASVSGAGEIEVTTNAALVGARQRHLGHRHDLPHGRRAGPRRRALPGQPGPSTRAPSRAPARAR